MNCAVVPGTILVLDGVMVMEVSVTGADLSLPHPAITKIDISTIQTVIAILHKVGRQRIALDIMLKFTKAPHTIH